MTQTVNLINLSNWLTQVLGGEPAAAPSPGEGAGFIHSLAAQIRSLALKQGADPAQLAAIDDQTLIRRCLALLEGQGSLTDLARLDLGAKAEGLGGNETDLQALEPDSPAPQSQDQGAMAAWLPSVLLDRLAQAGMMLLQDTQPQGSVVSNPPQTVPADQKQGAVWGSEERLFSAAALSSDPEKKVLGPALGVSPILGPTERITGAADFNKRLSLDPGLGQMRVDDWLRSLAAALHTLTDPAAQGLDEVGGLSRLSSEPPSPGARGHFLDLGRLLQPGGEQPLVERIRWSVEQGLDTAEIKLHPPNLGSLEVRVMQEGERIHVHFTAAHPVAREVLDAALPRLRDSLAQVGLWLGNASVSDQAPRRDQEQGRNARPAFSGSEALEEPEEERRTSAATLAILARRLDVFT